MEAEFALFNLLSGINNFWRGEYEKLGAQNLLAKLLNYEYSATKKMEEIDQRVKSWAPEKTWNEMKTLGINFICDKDKNWPISLELATPAPFGLQYLGENSCFTNLTNSISIVGTRNPTSYGERIASDFAAGFADRGWQVVSGGALGIDAAAHRGCLIAEGETIAVMAGGLKNLYPNSNLKLFERIIQSGLIISELPFDTPALPSRFLVRNRIIAAISNGVLVVEAAGRSGSLRTALDANKYHKPVFTIPGPITSPASEGCHRLVIERMGELVTSVGEIIELIKPTQPILI